MESKLQGKIRQPIVTVCGHVDHGKSSILDYFSGTHFQEEEAGGITQKISYTKFPLTQIKQACPLVDMYGVKLEIPGFLFIDTPGHAAFTNLRRRGGSLADLAILVVAIKEGIKPQTAEVLQILKNYKTPFLIALNKIDNISGWKRSIGKENSGNYVTFSPEFSNGQFSKTSNTNNRIVHNLKESIESQPIHVSQEFQEALLTFQASLKEHGFDSDLYYNISDFSKKVAIVPCSARTGEGIPELLFTLCGLCQRFLKERLRISDEAKGVILEIKKEKAMDYVESILYDGSLKVGDELVIASFGEPIISKIRALEEIEPLCPKYKRVESISAATGARIHLVNKEGVLPGMPFQRVSDNIEQLKKELKKELAGAMNLDKGGIIVKADSLGSLDAVLNLLRQENIRIVKAGIGPINKTDIISARANLELNPLDAAIVGFNVEIEEELDAKSIKILTNDVVYKLIEELQKWRKEKQGEIEKERLMGLATICKVEVLHKYVFRNSNPAIFGVRVIVGKIKIGIPLIDNNGDNVARVKGLQKEKESVHEAGEGEELAISLPRVNFERRLSNIKYLYADISERQFKEFKKNKDLLSSSELKVLQEIAQIKKF